MEEKVTVYDRKNQPVVMVHRLGSLYEKLDKIGVPTGSVVNLKVALENRAYFTTPKKGKVNEGA